MERKFKGIALMLLGIFLFLIIICITYFTANSYIFIAGLFVSFCIEAVGLHFVFSQDNNDTDKAVKNYFDGKEE